MQIETKKINAGSEVIIFTVSGKVMDDDSINLGKNIKAQIITLGQSPKVIVNLNGVTMMDSTGLGSLVAIYMKVADLNGQIVLCCLGRGMKNLIAITKLSKTFMICDTEEEALKLFSQGGCHDNQ